MTRSQLSTKRIKPKGCLRWHCWTDAGRFRSHNEDSFLGLTFDGKQIHRLGKSGEMSLRSMDFAFAVSDGMGGAKAGEYASHIATEKLTTLLPRCFQLSATGMTAGIPDVLSELFDQIHKTLVHHGRSYEECAGMESTLSLCWFVPGWMYFGHVGDSRIYYLPAKTGELKQLSHDDTYVGWMLRDGKLNEREARTHPQRHVLQKALGGGNQFVEPQVGAVQCEAGDRFLLCSDGLIDGLFDAGLLDYLRPAKPWPKENDPARELVRAAVENSGKDNTTAIVVELI